MKTDKKVFGKTASKLVVDFVRENPEKYAAKDQRYLFERDYMREKFPHLKVGGVKYLRQASISGRHWNTATGSTHKVPNYPDLFAIRYRNGDDGMKVKVKTELGYYGVSNEES